MISASDGSSAFTITVVDANTFTYAVPARYLIPPLQTLFLTGDIWSHFLPNIAIMIGFGLLFFLLSFRATRRSLD